MCRAESTCTGLLKYSPHSPRNCSRSCLRSPASFFFPVSPAVRLSISLIFLLVPCPFPCPSPHYLVHPPITPSTTLISAYFLTHSVSVTFLCCFHFHLHYHSPHPHLGVPLLSPVRLEWRITEIPSWLSWIGYADVTDTAAPHKYSAYYPPSSGAHV